MSARVEPEGLARLVSAFLAENVDYACNTNPYTRPDGQDVEVFTRAALIRASSAANSGPDREHVTPWIRRSADVARLDLEPDFDIGQGFDVPAFLRRQEG